MFIISQCKSLSDYDLFLEEYALGNKGDTSYPLCRGELDILYDKVPARIREVINRNDLSSYTVRWEYDLNQNNEVTGSIEFVFDHYNEWFAIEGNLDDWKVFQHA
jgi:hypothetical protein